MIDEFTFCDDCGSSNHTWENCPDTRDIPLRNPTYDISEVGIFDGYGEYDDWQSEADW